MIKVKKKILIFCVAFSLIGLWLFPVNLFASSAKGKYNLAERCYKELRNHPKRQKYRDQWLRCIKKFKNVYRYHPSSAWAPAGLYMAGKLYTELYKRSYKKSDKKEAIDIYERIIKRFPKSRYKNRAKKALNTLVNKKKSVKTVKKTKNTRLKRKKISDIKTSGNNLTYKIKEPALIQGKKDEVAKGPSNQKFTIKGLRFWSNPSYTRIVIDADGETSYTYKLLKKDPSLKKPQRLYIDLKDCRLGKAIQRIIPINDDLLKDARAGQYSIDSVRVVVDIKSFKTYKIFSLKNPFRIVVDVWGEDNKKSRSTIGTLEKNGKIPPGALAKQLALGVSRIVIDPGHGGRDYGAPGYLKGVHEKKVALKIAQRLAKKIREKLNCQVIMTRNSDRYLTLEERTAIANTKNADLFISIHTNAARNRKAYGIETFFLNLATDNDSILVAARENATSTKNISDLQTILSDLMQNAKINESSRLAASVQNSICSYLRKHYKRIKNKGVKQAPFYVLLGAQMPAILIETSFISNPTECRRLINTSYHDRLCEGIVNGIRAYMKETTPTAFLKTNNKKFTN